MQVAEWEIHFGVTTRSTMIKMFKFVISSSDHRHALSLTDATDTVVAIGVVDVTATVALCGGASISGVGDDNVSDTSTLDSVH